MRSRKFVLPAGRIWLLALMVLALAPVLLPAQLFTFNVSRLEAFDRSGNWVWDADAPGFVTGDGNWFTFGTNPIYSGMPGYPFHYYAEKYVHSGVNTTITCVQENVPFTNDPSTLSLELTQFNVVAFQRKNIVNPANPWNTMGESGDVRVYTNAAGVIKYNNVPVLSMTNATFVITTPYPTQAEIRALNPLFSSWTGSIGPGLVFSQSGYGFGDIDVANSNPLWAAMFAPANYKVDMYMPVVQSVPMLNTSEFYFALAIAPAMTPRLAGNQLVNLGSLPADLTFPGLDASVTVTNGTPGGSAGEMHHIYLNEVGVTPSGSFPSPYDFPTGKYWELGSTFESFNVNINFNLTAVDFAKDSGDWAVFYRPNTTAPWALWNDVTVVDASTIRANNVSQIGEFAISSMVNPLPVVMSTMYAFVNSDNLAQVQWSTASETDMLGFKVYSGMSNNLSDAGCITPTAIPAHNTSNGASYSYTASEITEPGEHWFWLEAMSFDGTSDFFGPMYVILNGDPGTPGLPQVNVLGSAYPNPFKAGDGTSFDVKVKEGESGMVTIYNTKGQTVAAFPLIAGSQVVNWNGRDAQGNLCSSGIYFYRLATDTFNGVRKMLVVK